MTGASVADDFGNIEQCLGLVALIAGESAEAIKLFKEGTATSIGEAMVIIGLMIQEVDKIKTACDIKVDTEKLEKMAKTLQSMESFVLNADGEVSINGNNIYTELKNSVDAWDKEDYFGVGDNLGNAMAKILNKPVETTKEDDLFLY